MSIEKVIVYGAGTMGPQVAQVAATSGLPVTIVAYREPYKQRSIDSIAKSISRFVKREKMTQDEMDAAMARISTTTDHVYDADIIIEAVIEDEKKRGVAALCLGGGNGVGMAVELV